MTNRNSVPRDPNGAWYTSGIRLGTPALTTLGFGPARWTRSPRSSPQRWAPRLPPPRGQGEVHPGRPGRGAVPRALRRPARPPPALPGYPAVTAAPLLPAGRPRVIGIVHITEGSGSALRPRRRSCGAARGCICWPPAGSRWAAAGRPSTGCCRCRCPDRRSRLRDARVLRCGHAAGRPGPGARRRPCAGRAGRPGGGVGVPAAGRDAAGDRAGRGPAAVHVAGRAARPAGPAVPAAGDDPAVHRRAAGRGRSGCGGALRAFPVGGRGGGCLSGRAGAGPLAGPAGRRSGQPAARCPVCGLPRGRDRGGAALGRRARPVLGDAFPGGPPQYAIAFASDTTEHANRRECAHRSWPITVFVLPGDPAIPAVRGGARSIAEGLADAASAPAQCRPGIGHPPAGCLYPQITAEEERAALDGADGGRDIWLLTGNTRCLVVQGPGRAAADDLGYQRRARGARAIQGRCLPLNTSGSPRRHSPECRHRCASKYTVISLPWYAFPGHGPADGDPGSASDADMASG